MPVAQPTATISLICVGKAMRFVITGLLIAASVVVTPSHGTVVFPGRDTVAPFLKCQSRAVNDLDDGTLPIAVVAKHVAARCQGAYSEMESTLLQSRAGSAL